MELGTLDGTNGFKAEGETSADFLIGLAVSTAGDVNGDGLADILIGHYDANNSAGASYVVFGKASGFDATLDLLTLEAGDGFRIVGEYDYDYSGNSVSAAGDLNGDGYDDLLIAAKGVNADTGAAYVIFGKASGFGSSFELSALNGANGFEIGGEAVQDRLGFSVSGAGDVNADGLDDILLGALGRDTNGNSAGAAYLVFGRATGFGSHLDLAALDGATGFEINGETAGDTAGNSVSAAGDINGDGYGDLLVGAGGRDTNGNIAGATYVIFGQASGFQANLNLATLTGANGFEINGEAGGDYSGYSVSVAGDVNGDGYDDIVIGARESGYTGAAYVVFGKSSGFTANLNLASLNGSNGFKIGGGSYGDDAGLSVSAAGDVNGDGYYDVLVGAPGRDSSGTGAIYVVFGHGSGFESVIDVSALTGTVGFRVDGEDNNVFGRSVSGAGDVNGDGFDDLVVGAPDFQGFGSGASYVLFGADFSATVDFEGTFGDDDLTGDGNANVQVAGLGNDTLNGGGGNDALKGGAGDDLLFGGAGDDRLFGGLGHDIASYEAEAAAVSVNLALGRASGTSAGADLLDAVEGIIGSALADTLTGSNDANTIEGGAGNDTLAGGAGGDLFRIGVGHGTDFITDFSRGDLIDVLGLEVTGVQAGDGSSVLAGEAEVSSADGITTVHIGTDGTLGADLSVTFSGGAARVVAGDIAFNGAPVVVHGLADKNALAGIEFEFVTEGAIADADAGDVLTYSATLHDGSPLPGWLSVDGETGAFSGTPATSDGGAIQVELTATDSGGLAVEDTFTISVDAGSPVLVTGLLDADFGNGGQVLTDFSTNFDAISDLAVQDADGKIIAVGSSGNDFAVARYNPDGSLDTTFSGDGKLATDFSLGFESARAVALAPDGKIVVAGDSIGTGAVAVARYNLDGTLDNTFSGDGKVTTAGPPASTSANDVAVQSDGKVLVAGSMDFGMSVLRYEANGLLDNTFDGDGKVLIDLSSSSARAIAVQDDGKIVAAGSAIGAEDTHQSFTVVRLDSDGSLDETFGTNGVVLTAVGEQGAQAVDLAIQADGKIVVLGNSHNGTNSDFTVARYNEDGTLDTGFGEGGLATVDFGATEFLGRLALQDDGKIVVTGGFSGFNIARFDSNGSLDASFDGDGIWVIPVGEGSNSATSIALLPDGGLVVGGQATGSNSDFALIRTLPAGVPDLSAVQDAEFGESIASYFADPNGGTLTYSATLEGGDPLPDWLSIDPDTGAFSGTPSETDLGAIEIEVTVSDGESEPVSDVFVLTVTSGADSIVGTAGDDTLNAGVGVDTMVGLQGNDTYIVDNPADVITEEIGAAAGLDEARSSVSYTLPANVEDLFLTGDAPINGTGNNLVNLIVGNSAANRLDGGALDDDLRGEDGNDTYVVDNTNDQVIEEAGEGTADLVESSVTYELPDHVENITLVLDADRNATGNGLANILTGNTGNNDLEGLGENDTIFGGEGNDTLDGGTGADSMLGGAGDDVYIVDSEADSVVELPSQGSDLLRSSVTRTLGAEVENLILTGGAAINGTGNELANQLIGNDGNNELRGLAGDDLLKGADTLDGVSGADTLYGGLGSDLYYVDSADDRVIELAGEGTADTIYTAINLTLPENVERVEVIDANAHALVGNGLANIFRGNVGNDTLAGGGGNDTLEGGGGADQLDGGIGADSMVGGSGNDLYFVDSTGDIVLETTNSGALTLPNGDAGLVGPTGDTVKAAINYAIGNFVEHLELVGAASRGTGNALANSLKGNAAANSLAGVAGNDTLDGSSGNDTLEGGVGNDLLLGGAGTDRLIWDGNKSDRFNGGTGVDTLRSSISLDLTKVSSANVKSIEQIDLSASGKQKLTLNVTDVLDLSEVGNTIKVLGGKGDSVDIVGKFTRGGASGGFRSYKVGSGILQVDTDVVVA